MMVANTSKAFNIDDMSRVAYISPYHFIRVFHSVTGVAPCKFLWALKLHAAKELLFASTMPIVDISMEVGYNSLGTFTRRFTQLVGLPPHRFRRLATTADSSMFEDRARDPNTSSQPRRTISGHVRTPIGFRGVAVVACFPTGLSQGTPLQYAWTDDNFNFRMAYPNASSFYLRAFGVPEANSGRCWFTDDRILRSCETAPYPVRQGCSPENEVAPEMVLRPRLVTDPPILVSLATLLPDFQKYPFGARRRPVSAVPVLHPGNAIYQAPNGFMA
jgi:AraC-like DNA-binding protein